MKLLHMLAHWTGWNYGTVEVWWDFDKLMIGFKCSTCGKISGIHQSYRYRKELPK